MFCCDDAHALFISEICKICNLHIPDQIALLGVEETSVAPPEYTAEVHRQLLGTGMVLLEGLDLSKAKVNTTYLLIAAPLKIAGADATPVRALLVEPQRIDWDENLWTR